MNTADCVGASVFMLLNAPTTDGASRDQIAHALLQEILDHLDGTVRPSTQKLLAAAIDDLYESIVEATEVEDA